MQRGRCLRAGQLGTAQAVCGGAGQAWREASLGACAAFGPAPVGSSADAEAAAEAAAAAEWAAETHVAEHEEGSGAFECPPLFSSEGESSEGGCFLLSAGGHVRCIIGTRVGLAPPSECYAVRP